ncbi:hypothetical protein [Mycolicibacterium sp.]|uniref:hypothetical protein n=1 Tax=Mycolicibacterium sp. TaxID=2320850 RepID=UPI001A359C14|nr:hypothetical protein [Mycolicibacterium sp.]MBJ7339322.1 hypothetical protein [Mycolicibacterium sp.]
MDDVTFDRELQNRIRLIESPDGPSLTVPDLPLKDVLLLVMTLAVVIGALMWWAY